MEKKSIIAVLTLCLSSVATAAQAAGPYVGVLGGSIEMQQSVPFQILTINEAGESIVIESGVRTVKDDRSAYGALLGWQLHPNIALETSYLRSTATRETLDDATTLNSRISAWSATALYMLPLSPRWSAHARLGGIRRTHTMAVGFQGNAPVTYTGHSNGFLYGAGLGMRIERLHLRFDLQRSTMHSERTSIITLGANWFF